MEQIKITDDQARRLASVIIADIPYYVSEHQQQFNDFVKKEAIKGQRKKETSTQTYERK